MDLGAKPLSFTSSSASRKSADVVADQFPAGLRVLVVDDDPTCLRILEKMLKNCLYEVTKCNRAELALKYLRDNKNGYDVVISDVHMPDMDGFKLLERVGLEMDLPVIMMSADDSKNVVMKGITHGACDYLIKPVRMEALKNIWQHVVRKKKHEWREKDFEQSGSVEEGERQQKPVEDVDYSSSANEGNWKSNSKKRKEEEDEADERDDTSTLKKPRVVWSVELHQQFVTAVNQLGIDKAVPKKILELMNVPGLTRENVASHLQKYRLYLRRLSGVSQHQNGLGPSFIGPTDTPFGPISSLTGVDLQALAASGQLPPQSLATIQAAALGRPGPATKSPLGDQRNIFSFENPKLRFVDGPPPPPPQPLQQPPPQQQINNTKQVNLLHGIPTNMDSKQLANLHQSAQHYGGPVLTQMVQPQPRTQILSEVNGNQSQPILSQVIPSVGVRGPPPYVTVSHPSPVVDFSRVQSQGNNSFAPSYDIFSELNQNRNQEWRLQNPGPSFEAPQGLVQQPFSSNQKTGQNIVHQASPSVAENALRIKTEKLPDMGFQNGVFSEHFGQEDLMSAILKQQEGGVGPVENEFGFDGYHLDNLPV